MREIKFRAWNKELGIMCFDNEDDTACYWDGVFSSDVGMINFRLSGIDLFTHKYMQCVGLKDKNGVSIYEGDVVLYEGFKFTINHEYGSFNIVRKSKKIDMCNMFKNCWNDDIYPLIQLYWEENEEEGFLNCLEVIGNIYKNPELLEEIE